jgi:DNA primase
MSLETRAALDEIKRRYPLQEVVARFAPELRHSGSYLTGHCPFHDDRRPSFAVHLPTETWRCYAAACDLGGDVIDLVGHSHFGRAWNSRDKVMFKEALRRLTEGEMPPLRRPIPKAWREARQWRPLELTLETQLLLHTAARIYHTTLLTMGRGSESPDAYLRARGFSEQTIRSEGIGYASGDLLGPALAACGLSRAMAAEANLLDAERHGREFMAGRIVFVEQDRSGRVLHLIGRAFAPWLGPDAPKYLSLREMAKPLYGYARLDKRESDRPVILVESPPDAVTARQWGFDALATTGARLKDEHAVMLGRLRRPLVIVPHNDGGAGLEAAGRWLKKIGHGQMVVLPEGSKDLNELGTKSGGEGEFVARLRAAGLEPALAQRRGA